MQDTLDQGALEIQKQCIPGCCPWNCVSSYKLGKTIANKLLKDVDELIDTGKSYCKNDEIAHKLPIRSIDTMPVGKTVGLDLMLEKVWRSIEEKDVGVIGLYAMGGAGKTTLLKRINNEFENRKPKFDVVMWVVVSKDLNYDSIMDNIRKKVGIKDDTWGKCNTREEKVSKIYDVLKRKKFVLLLDDIWDKVDFEMMGVPNPDEPNFQSKVLLTTRYENVCDKMLTQRKFKVECLTKKEAFELFCMKVGEETLQSHPQVRKLARDMAAKCQGLPLALIVVGSAMAGVKSLKAWKHSKDNLTSFSMVDLGLETKVFSVLKFSYDRLPDEIHKKCFLYCALYPEDSEINVDYDLIDKWIWEGFLGKDATKSVENMRDHGELVIETLKRSCLLENVRNDSCFDHVVKMHDMIRDMALWLARDQDKDTKRILVQGDSRLSQCDAETCEVVERVSTTNCDELLFVPAASCPNLTTLIFEVKDIFKEGTIDFSNFDFMSRLKVLHLSCGYRELVLRIGCLVHLEYLHLSGGPLKSEFLIELKNLRKLKHLFFDFEVIRGDNNVASILFEVIASLEQLRVFRFLERRGSVAKEEEREMLEKLESLQHLEELWIEIRSRDGVMKLLESSKLQNCLSILRLDELVETDASSSVCPAFDTCRLSLLRAVFLSDCHAFIDLTWIKYAPLLQVLNIIECGSLEEVIKEETEIVDDQNVIFSSLVEFRLYDLPKLKSIHNRALSFASLIILKIKKCPNLNKLPFDSNTDIHNLREFKVDQDWWDNLEWEDPAIKHELQPKFREY